MNKHKMKPTNPNAPPPCCPLNPITPHNTPPTHPSNAPLQPTPPTHPPTHPSNLPPTLFQTPSRSSPPPVHSTIAQAALKN